jgi:quercetin dioxygenase-like cupin family protein
MRPLAASALLATMLTACAGPHATRVSTPSGPLDLDQFLASHALAEEGGVRADQIGRTDGASYHIVQVHGSEKPHRHETHDLTVFILRGHGVLTRAAGRTPLQQGDAVVVPRGEPHWWASEGAFPAVTLVVFSPPLDAPDAVPVEPR